MHFRKIPLGGHLVKGQEEEERGAVPSGEAANGQGDGDKDEDDDDDNSSSSGGKKEGQPLQGGVKHPQHLEQC